MKIAPGLMARLILAMPLASRIEAVDVGASTIQPAEKPNYDALLSHGIARLTAFEPNPAELAKLMPDDTRRYLPHVIGDGSEADFNLTRHPGFSSTLQPNPAINAHIHSFTALTEVTSRRSLATRRLDDLADIARIDFLKIDIQGGELAAFDGGRNKLSGALCVQTEVAFLPIYENQPLFADQDAMLRSFGLRFFGLASVNRFPFVGTPRDLYFPSKRHDLGQWVDADAVYLRDFTQWETLPDEELRRLFYILALSFPAMSAVLRLGQILVGRGALAASLLREVEAGFAGSPASSSKS